MRVAALVVLVAVLAAGVWAGGRLFGDEDDARSYSRVLDAAAEGGILHTHIETYVKDGLEVQFRCLGGEADVPGYPYVRSEHFTEDLWLLIGSDGLPVDLLSFSHDSGGKRVLSVYMVGDDAVFDLSAVGLVCTMPDVREPVTVGGVGDHREVFRRRVQKLKDGEESGELRREPSGVDGTFDLVQEGTVCGSQLFLDIESQRVLRRRLVLESDYTVISESCSAVAEGGRELLIESYEFTFEHLDASEWPALLNLVFPEGLPAASD